jgi:hypothetical protein
MARSSAVKIEQKESQRQAREREREGMKKAKEGGELSGLAEPSVNTEIDPSGRELKYSKNVCCARCGVARACGLVKGNLEKSTGV